MRLIFEYIFFSTCVLKSWTIILGLVQYNIGTLFSNPRDWSRWIIFQECQILVGINTRIQLVIQIKIFAARQWADINFHILSWDRLISTSEEEEKTRRIFSDSLQLHPLKKSSHKLNVQFLWPHSSHFHLSCFFQLTAWTHFWSLTFDRAKVPTIEHCYHNTDTRTTEPN